MAFEKGHNFGVRFSSDNQPSDEAKHMGWQRRRIMRQLALYVAEQKVPSPKVVASVLKVCPDLTEDDVTMALGMVTKLSINALNGDIAALRTYLRILGED